MNALLIVAGWAALFVVRTLSNTVSPQQTPATEPQPFPTGGVQIADVQMSDAYTQIEASCTRDFRIDKSLLATLHSPVKMSVMHNPPSNVQCFARCVIERYGYYQYHVQVFDVERLVQDTKAVGLTENNTRYFVDKCMRIAWLGEENCEDFWNVYKCFHGSV